MTTDREPLAQALPVPGLDSAVIDQCVFALTGPELLDIEAAASTAGRAIVDLLDDATPLLKYEEALAHRAAMRADAAVQAGYLLGLAAGHVTGLTGGEQVERAQGLAQRVVAEVVISRLPGVAALAVARAALDALRTAGNLQATATEESE